MWNIAQKKVVRGFSLKDAGWFMFLAISADGRRLAVPWRPKSKADADYEHDADSRDFPQPRVTLFDLSGDAPPAAR